jgi:hypothetical protein
MPPLFTAVKFNDGTRALSQPKWMNGFGTGTGSPSTFTYLKRERRRKTAKRSLRNVALSLWGCDTLSAIAPIKCNIETGASG